MTASSIAALLSAMMVLAIIPDASAFAVVARSIASGFSHGLVTTIGIVVGDFFFIILAIYGLSIIAESIADLFIAIKYLGGTYLVWLGTGLWRSITKETKLKGIHEPSWWSNFLCGLFITLGDVKVILFYLSFLPAFLDLARATVLDTGIVMATATIAVCGVKLSYAYMAGRARRLFESTNARRRLNRIAGSMMIGTGIFLIVTT